MEILDVLLFTPYHFDVDCSLPSLWEWIVQHGRPKSQLNYEISERQRLLFALVCRSWKNYAESRANRSEHIITALPHSRRIKIEDVDVEHPGVSTRWEILVARLEDEAGHGAEHFRKIAQNIHLHKNIKRIDLQIIGPNKLPDLMHILSAFDRLVSLSITLDDGSGLSLPPEPISLPNLNTLVLKTPYMLQYPHKTFEMPSLVNLRFGVTEDAPSFEELLHPYHSKLKNLTICWGSLARPTTTWTLPGWNFFPHLEELVLHEWGPHTPTLSSPLPPKHPLGVVRVDQISWPFIDQLLPGRGDPNISERNSIRRISILALIWCSGGYHYQEGEYPFCHAERTRVHALANQCADMGIRLEDTTGFCLDESGSVADTLTDLKGFLVGTQGTGGYEFEYSHHDQYDEIVYG